MSPFGDRLDGRKKVAHVPAFTYPSAAGLQSEIASSTLTRLAQHQTDYKRQVEFYRNELRNKLNCVQDQQESIKK